MAQFCACGCGTWVNSTYVLGHHQIKTERYEIRDCGHDSPCWIWQLAIDRNGYGADSVDGKKIHAHRVAWTRERGPIPKGAQVDHLCHVRACVNVAHMELVNGAENSRRKLTAKLDYEKVAEIRELRAAGMFQREVAELFGICRQTVSDIDRGLIWATPGEVFAHGT